MSSLIACGCSRDIPEVKQTPAEKHLVMLPGVEGSGWQLGLMVKGLRDAGIEHEIEIIAWGRYPFGTLPNLMDINRNRQRAKEIAAHLAELRNLHPNGEIVLLGYSGGGGLAVLTLEYMPDDVKVSRAILVAAALSPKYDLTRATQHTEQGITSYYSTHDNFFLNIGTGLFGTIDRVRTSSAGRDGFKDAEGDLRKGEQLSQIPWREQWFCLGHWGGHLGWLTRAWAREVLAAELQGRTGFGDSAE